MAVQLVTDEVLTERKAGWHAGRWRSWGLRGGSEIALLHYITADWIVMAAVASCHHEGVTETGTIGCRSPAANTHTVCSDNLKA